MRAFAGRLVGAGRFRRRLTAMFVVTAALSAGALAVVTFAVSSGYRWHRFHDAAAGEVRLALALAPAALDEASFQRLLGAHEARIGTDTIAVAPMATYSSSQSITTADIPSAWATTEDGLQVTTTSVRGRTYLVLSGTGRGDVRYVFFFSTDEVTASLHELGVVLAAAWLATTTAAAALGHLVARRTLRPVGAAADAAAALAAGRLDTRLDPGGDDEFGVWAASFNQMADALEEKIAALRAVAERERRLTADVAHELRTPLTGMTATVSLLEEDLDRLPPPLRRLADVLIRDVRRLRNLVLELLELSELERGVAADRPERIDLGDLVRAVVATAETDGTDIRVVAHDGVTVTADRARLRRVVSNLVSNAVRHGCGPVEVSVAEARDGARIAVSDHGPGVAEKDLPHLFERFYKSDRARASGGSGLGLAIALQHAHALGASLGAANRPGGGACFELHLPATADGDGDGRARPGVIDARSGKEADTAPSGARTDRPAVPTRGAP